MGTADERVEELRLPLDISEIIEFKLSRIDSPVTPYQKTLLQWCWRREMSDQIRMDSVSAMRLSYTSPITVNSLIRKGLAFRPAGELRINDHQTPLCYVTNQFLTRVGMLAAGRLRLDDLRRFNRDDHRSASDQLSQEISVFNSRDREVKKLLRRQHRLTDKDERLAEIAVDSIKLVSPKTAEEARDSWEHSIQRTRERPRGTPSQLNLRYKLNLSELVEFESGGASDAPR